MEATSSPQVAEKIGILGRLRQLFAGTPVLGWLTGAMAAVLLEQAIGLRLAWLVGLPKVPVLFGFTIMLKKPVLIPSAMIYVLLIYALPVGLVARLCAAPVNRLAGRLIDITMPGTVLLHLLLLYAILHIWASLSDYRYLTLNLTLIFIMVTLSLNVINGYMGEFSCSHPGFIALGAYTSSVFTVGLFANDPMFGDALLPAVLGPFLFPIGLVLGGFAASLGALLVAIPSFRTRGDYLAIISLAFMFIIKSLFENLEFVGGPRGLSGQPNWANLPTVFTWTVACIWVINNFVRSTIGKALNAVRDEETAANAMTVNTRRTKILAFMFAAFWAGVAGGLFAHVIRYVNPAMFGIQQLAQVLAMVYFGGLNSVYGSIVGAVSLSMLSEMLRPLELFKWIVIPLLLILVMIFRPTGLIAFTEFNVKKVIQPKRKTDQEV